MPVGAGSVGPGIFGGGGGGGTIKTITSTGGTITVTNPTGPTTDIEANTGTSVVVYVSATGSNSNSGLIASAPKDTLAHAIAALPAGGGMIYCLSQNIPAGGACVLPTGCVLDGIGQELCSINWPIDLGAGIIGLALTTGSNPSMVRNVGLIGPGAGSLSSPGALMSGIQTTNQSVLQDVNVSGFYAGVVIGKDHERLFRVNSQFNWYNVYHSNPADTGQQVYRDCHFDYGVFAGVAVASGAAIDGVLFETIEIGTCPISFFKEGTTPTNNFITNTVMVLVHAEGWGNAMFKDINTSAAYGVSNLYMVECSGNYASGGLYNNPAYGDTYIFDLYIANGIQLINCTLPPNPYASGSYLMNVRTQSSNISFNRLPLNTDFSPTQFCELSGYTTPLFVGALYISSGTINSGDLVQMLGSSDVTVERYTGAGPVLGVAATLANGYVVVQTQGAAAVNTVVSMAGGAVVSPNATTPYLGDLSSSNQSLPIIGIATGNSTTPVTIELTLSGSSGGPSVPVGTYQLITASGTGSTLPAGTYKFRCVSGGNGGSGGGAAALTGGVSNQVGGPGGTGGLIAEGEITIASPSAPVFVVGSGGGGGNGGAASSGVTGNAGVSGSVGTLSSVALSGTTITAEPYGSVSNGGGANSTSTVGQINLWSQTASVTSQLPSPGVGGAVAQNFGAAGGNGTTSIVAGGGGGVPASATLGGLGGNAGARYIGGASQVTTGGSGTTTGVIGASAAANTGAGGGGGGGGAPGGAGGNGGAGGSGYVELWRIA